MRVLVTGAAGYIGSHTCRLLLADGWDVVALDDFSSGHADGLARALGLADAGQLGVVPGRVQDEEALDAAFTRFGAIDAVIHLAAHKSVAESVARPLLYWRDNVGGAVALAGAMLRHGCQRLVFSSTAAVYGRDAPTPVGEDAPVRPGSPYGQTKLATEQMLTAAAEAHGWRVLLLRYFNPAGAHPSGRLGEDQTRPANLVPILLEVASGKRPSLTVFGVDYDTPDGSAVRDFLHVEDLAAAHRVGLRHIDERVTPGSAAVYNVGTGRGCSVLELVESARRVTGQPLPVVVGERRPGDLASAVADVRRFEADFGFRCGWSLDVMLADAWRWHQAQERDPWRRGDAGLHELLDRTLD